MKIDREKIMKSKDKKKYLNKILRVFAPFYYIKFITAYHRYTQKYSSFFMVPVSKTTTQDMHNRYFIKVYIRIL